MNEKKNDYKVMVNPTFLTAQSTLQMLAKSGDQDAIEYTQILKFNDLDKKKPVGFKEEEIPQFMQALAISIEARYKMVNWLMQQSGYQNMLDIACGYTPRALVTINDKKDYVGLDIPAVIEQLLPISSKLFAKHKHPLYVSGDVTNISSLQSAADYLNGEVFISCEGLIGYLSKTELESMLYNIRQILLSHGGAWYSSDFEVEYGKIVAVALGSKEALMKFQESVKDAKNKTDIYFNSGAFLNTIDKKKFIEDHGFHVERVPFYQENILLNALEKIEKDQKNAVIELLKTFHVWKITANDRESKNIKKVESVCNGRLTISADIIGKELHMYLAGRMDTLTAPNLLEFFDSVYEADHIERIVLDLKNLEYTSSAGLRTMLVIGKKIGTENLDLKNTNEIVKRILEDTGFDQILNII